MSSTAIDLFAAANIGLLAINNYLLFEQNMEARAARRGGITNGGLQLSRTPMDNSILAGSSSTPNMMQMLGEAACAGLAQWLLANTYGSTFQSVNIPALGGVSFGVGTGIIAAVGNIAGGWLESVIPGGFFQVGGDAMGILTDAAIKGGAGWGITFFVDPNLVSSIGQLRYFGQMLLSNYMGGFLYTEFKAPLLGL